MKHKGVVIFLAIGLMYIATAQGIYDNCEIYGNCVDQIIIPFDNTTAFVNNSYLWAGNQYPSLTDGSVLFWKDNKFAENNSNFFWDNVNKRLGIGTNYPITPLNIVRSGFGEMFQFDDGTSIIALETFSSKLGAFIPKSEGTSVGFLNSLKTGGIFMEERTSSGFFPRNSIGIGLPSGSPSWEFYISKGTWATGTKIHKAKTTNQISYVDFFFTDDAAVGGTYTKIDSSDGEITQFGGAGYITEGEVESASLKVNGDANIITDIWAGDDLFVADRVGIGTTTPLAKTVIARILANDDWDALHIANHGAWSGAREKHANIVFTDSWSVANHAVGAIGVTFTNNSLGRIDFHSLYNGGYKTDSDIVMSILGNGNVGIGTTTPKQKLDVNGSVNITGDLDYNRHYAQISYHNETDPLVIDLVDEDVYVNVTGLHVDYSNGINTTGMPTITKTDMYQLTGSISFNGGNSGLYRFNLFVNGLEEHACGAMRTTTSSSIGSLSINCLVLLNEGDQVNIMVKDTTSPIQDVNLYTVTLNMVQI